MELEGVKRVAFWGTLFIFIALMGIFGTGDKISILFRVILITLLAILSAMFRLEDKYSVLSIVLVVIAGIFIGMMVAVTGYSAQFWSFAFLFVIMFFLACEVFDRNLMQI